MNGRIYDPLLGRFLSADLMVENVASLQSYNRYSYVRNNPLTFTDPTGFYSILGLEFIDGGGVKGFFSDLASYGGAAASGAGEGAVGYANGFNSGVVGAIKGTGQALADPVGAFKATGEGLGTLAGRTVYDTKAVVAETIADLSNPAKIGESFGNAVTATAIGVGAAKGLSAASEVTSTAASTEKVAPTGTAEARVAAAAPETGPAPEVNTQTAPASEVRGGRYGHLEDGPKVGSGKDYTATQKAKILAENEKANGGVLRDDVTGEAAVREPQSQKGVTPPENGAQVDHYYPKSEGGPNSYSNAEVRLRKHNIKKSDEIPE
jgi:hypothetical protein